MKHLVICQDEFIIRLLYSTLSSPAITEFILDDKPLAQRLLEDNIPVHIGNPHRVNTYLSAGVDPTTCIIVEDSNPKSSRHTVEAIRDAGGQLIYLLNVGTQDRARQESSHDRVIGLSRLNMADLLRGSLRTELNRSMTRARVEQYQRYLADADRILILLHNDPDPDALASGLALRNLLRRTKTTAIIGTFQGITRPENLRMAALLDIDVELLTRSTLTRFDRIVTVDVQPHYFGGLLNRADLVIDHHPARAGYSATFRDIRPEYGSTCTILTEHLRAVGLNISERTATAMLYAIKSDTLFFSRQTNESDLDAFRFLYPLANPVLIRKMEGAEADLEKLSCISGAIQRGTADQSLYTTHIGTAAREDLITYVADFLLQVEEISWVVVSGIVHGNVVISVRNLDESRNAGEFVKNHFADIGSAGGHRVMAKAVAPLTRFREKFGSSEPDRIHAVTRLLADRFLQEKKETKNCKAKNQSH